ncbi:MAG: HD domain-containing protein [Ilumatobacter sp.]|uniref:HD domain-containing protein n=1 Tax=Ilumatobacter sp. TaxID=1967498 RepID=UPI0026370E79|nr:HD domain-containing protein [Ilumatobacter sp.]MDJ0768489.1 HD domain-containing protein [Ilumatobacter sp.]
MAGDDLELRVAWQRHLGRSSAADRWFDVVVAHHREPHRRYHTLRHVVWVLRHIGELAAEHPGCDVDAVAAAGFFHDVVYEPTHTDNEAASARLAERALRELGWSADAAGHVAQMIEATAGHQVDAGADLGTAILVAADLGVLAAEPAKYADYARNVRHEYHHVDDHAWASGRGSFLRSMLERSHIFPSVLGLTSWEQRARANLTDELAALFGGSPTGNA